MDENQFGEVALAVNVNSTSFNARLTVRKRDGIPPQFARSGEEAFRRLSKLELLAICMSSRWEVGITPSVFKVVDANWYSSEVGFSRNRWLWVVMADMANIFGKGVTQIRTDMSAMYYEYRSRAQDLSHLEPHHDNLQDWSSAIWSGLLAGKRLDDLLENIHLAIENEEVVALLDIPSEGDDDNVLVAAAPSLRVGMIGDIVRPGARICEPIRFNNLPRRNYIL